MLDQLQKHLDNNFPFLKNRKLLVTVSGGVDSIVQAYLFKTLNYNIGIAHCNFQLRETESNKDEQFVEYFSDKHKAPFHVIQFNTQEYCTQNKVSTQIGARELRYKWFDKLCSEFNYDYILTAHHLNDVMETFFINLSRGTGIDGLTGIPPINQNIIRPLLPFSRKEIEQFAIKNKITWREDKSNAETKYLRNKIRHKIIPEFYELNPQFEENFKTTIANVFKTKAFVQQKIKALKETIFIQKDDGIHIPINTLLSLSSFEIYELFKNYGFHSSTEIEKLTQAQTGKETHSLTHRLLVNRNEIILYSMNIKEEKSSYTIQNSEDLNHIPIDLKITLTETKLDNNNIAIDISKTPFPLNLRKRKEGDVFYPTGMMGKKKISKYFKDQKFSKLEKDKTWLLCNQKDEIIWIVGHRADKNQISKSKNSNTIYIQHK